MYFTQTKDPGCWLRISTHTDGDSFTTSSRAGLYDVTTFFDSWIYYFDPPLPTLWNIASKVCNVLREGRILSEKVDAVRLNFLSSLGARTPIGVGSLIS